MHAGVRAELAAMTARAGRTTDRLRTAPPPPGSDFASAAVAASNERTDRLRAIRASGIVAALAGSQRRQTLDKIRRRTVASGPRTPSVVFGGKQHPPRGDQYGDVGTRDFGAVDVV